MSASDRKPMILFFAGPNGSGKTTITQYFELVGTYTNADELAKQAGIDNLEAAKRVDQRRYDSIQKGEDFTFETVLSSKYKLDILRTAKAKGYFLKGVFILTADPYINVGRVNARVAAGGHPVDEDKIVSRYYKAIANIPELIQLCDILHIYDNTETPVRIVRKHKEYISIFPTEFWPEDSIMKLIGYAED